MPDGQFYGAIIWYHLMAPFCGMCVPEISFFKVFGCMAYAHVPDAQRRKLDVKAEKLRFVGYNLRSKISSV